MTVQYHDPKADPMTPAEPYRLGLDLTSGEPSAPVVGLLANGFPDSDTFLEQVEAALGERLPQVTFRHFNKRNASIRVTEEMLTDIVSDCDVLLAAYGH